MKKWLLYIVPLLLLLPTFMLRDYTPSNELRYVSIVEEALNQGSVFVFYNHGIPYADKPPLYFWLMMLGRLISPNHIMLFMGAINLIAMGIILKVMNKWCFKEQQVATIAPPMLTLLTAGMFLGTILVLRMDLLMTMFIILSLYTFYKMYTGRNSKDDEWLFPVYIFLGIFSKGPIGILIPVLSILLFLFMEGKLRTAGRYLGLRTWGILLALCLIWFLGVFLEGGRDYLDNLLFNQTVNRAVDSFHHKQPFYYYITRFWMTAAPWSIFLFFAFIKGFKEKIVAQDPLLKLFAVIIISSFIMLSVISSKIDIYLVPIYPFIVYFAFVVLNQYKGGIWIRMALAIPVLVLLVTLPALLIGMKNAPFPPKSMFLLLFGGAIMTTGGLLALFRLFKKQINSTVVICASSLLLFIFITSFQIPAYNSLLGYETLADQGKELAKLNKTSRYAFFKVGRAENMDVYLNNQLVEVDSLSQLSDPLFLPKPYILFVREKDIRRNEELNKFLDNREHLSTGEHSAYIIKEQY